MTHKTPCRNRCCSPDVSGEFETLVVTGDTTLECLVVDTDTLVVDCVNHRVGIGTLTPSVKLEVVGSMLVGSSIFSVDDTANRTIFGSLAGSGVGDVEFTTFPVNDVNVFIDNAKNITDFGNYPALLIGTSGGFPSINSDIQEWIDFSPIYSILTAGTLTRHDILHIEPEIRFGATDTLDLYNALSIKPITTSSQAPFNGTITQANALHILNSTIGAQDAITTQAGIYIDAISGATTNYSLYTNAGIVRLGDDTYWVGAGSGLPYGEIYQQGNASPTVIATQNVWVKIANMTAGLGNLTTPSAANDNITILQAGVYEVKASVNFLGTATNTYEISVSQNGTPLTNIYYISPEVGVDILNAPLTGLVNCAINDTLDIMIRCTDLVTGNATVVNANLNVTMVGG